MIKQRLDPSMLADLYHLDYMPDGEVLLIFNHQFTFSGYTVKDQTLTIDPKCLRVMHNDELFAYYLPKRK